MLAASSLVGTEMLRYIIAVSPLVTLPADDVVRADHSDGDALRLSEPGR
jgi:hypothetical protein